MPAGTKIPISFLVTEGVLLLDLASIAEPFRLANDWARAQRRAQPFELSFIGPRAAVRTSLGLVFQDIHPLPPILASTAWLIVPGNTASHLDPRSPGMKEVIEWMASVGSKVARRLTVCSGALLAGAAGWLEGRHCTTHHGLLDRLRKLAPGAKIIDDRIYVIDGDVATSAGITAGIDLSLWAIGSVLGPEGALAVARELVIFTQRAGGDPQISAWLAHRSHLHPAIHRVQDAIAQAPAQAWSLLRMAKVALVGQRHLCRLFQDHAGTTPLQYLHRIRLAVARGLLADSSRSIEQVAASAGFSSAHQLRRAWRREFGGTPRGH